MVCLVVATFPGRGPAGVYQQRLYCHGILPIMRCAFGVHLDFCLLVRPTPCRFIETVRVSFVCFREDGRLLIRRNRNEKQICIPGIPTTVFN